MSDRCLLLIAHPDDSAVRFLTSGTSARVVHATVDDLSRAGWRYESGRPERAAARGSGRVLDASDIAAVLCRVHIVTSHDLPHVHRDDREYVASEINGFLYAWLAQFTGVRFNEPTWTSLAGPGLHPLQWTRFVSRLRIPVAPTPQLAELETITATVVSDEVFGVGEPALVSASLRIARAARARLLSVTFVRDGEWRFLSADPCPVLDASSAAALMKRTFRAPEPEPGVLCGAA